MRPKRGRCCSDSSDRSLARRCGASGRGSENVEQLVHEPDLVFDIRLTAEAVSAP